jgi:malonyl-CoA/methylmalonyl-CoA synthetase
VVSLFPRLDAPDDAIALRVDDVTLTYRELAGAVTHHVHCLARAGVKAGSRVVVWTDPTIATPVALIANALFGAVSVPLNPHLGAAELRHILDDAEPEQVVGRGAADAAGRPHMPIEVRPDAAVTSAWDAPDGASPLLVLYTSGTTGSPKGAVLTAKNCASNLDALARAWAWTDRDTVVHALPLFHVHGLVLGLFGSLRMGGTLSWVPRLEPDVLVHRLASGTMLFAVPTIVRRLADALERDSTLVPSVQAARMLVSGSAGLPLREHQRIEALTGRGVVERYGLTETLINCAVPHDARRPGYVGCPLSGVELALVDDERRPLAPSLATDDTTIGEVAVRGPNVFAGYLGRPDATRAVIDDNGWFYTGDLATRTADGYLRIVGRRATDLIKTGGFKVGAGEVEAALLEHPDVREAAVVGQLDDDLGERIVAYVVARDPQRPPTEVTLAAHVSAQLAVHKRPRAVVFLAELPRNAMGKVQKKRLSR